MVNFIFMVAAMLAEVVATVTVAVVDVVVVTVVLVALLRFCQSGCQPSRLFPFSVCLLLFIS